MSSFAFLVLLLGAVLPFASGHPPAFVNYTDYRIEWASSNFSSLLTSHLSPYQSSSVEHVLSGQVQQANGWVIRMALAIREDMTFDGTKKRHGWPAYQLHWVTMSKAGHWMSEHDWEVVEDVIVPKQMHIDPQDDDGMHSLHGYAVDVVTHLNDAVIPGILYEIEQETGGLQLYQARHYQQEVVEYLRADVQDYGVENWSMNQTVLAARHVKLVDVIFISRCKFCDDQETKNVGVGVVGVDKDGTEIVLSVFSEVMYRLRKEQSGKDEDDDKADGGDSKCEAKSGRGMKGGSVFAVVLFVSSMVGVASFVYGRRKGMGGHQQMPNLDEFNDSGTELTGMGIGYDMRSMNQTTVVRAGDIDGGDEAAI